MISVTVPVTEEHIRHGRRAQGQSCAVALALRDAGFEKVTVGGRILGIYKGLTLVMDTPLDLRWWIDRFDNGRPVHPMEVTLNLTCPEHGHDVGQRGCLYCSSLVDDVIEEVIEEADWDALMASTKPELVAV